MKQVKRGEVYYADLSPTVGSEQDGIRPVLILQNDIGNKHSPTTIVAPITSRRGRSHLPIHVSVKEDGLKCESIILLEQIRTIDKSRLDTFVTTVSKQTMGTVDHVIITSLGIKAMEDMLR